MLPFLSSSFEKGMQQICRNKNVQIALKLHRQPISDQGSTENTIDLISELARHFQIFIGNYVLFLSNSAYFCFINLFITLKVTPVFYCLTFTLQTLRSHKVSL